MPGSDDPEDNTLQPALITTSLDKTRLHSEEPHGSRGRYPSSNNGENGGHDVDSSTELWDDPDEEPHCSHCSTSLHNHYTDTLKLKIKQQQHTLEELKKRVQELEGGKIQEVELRRRVEEQEQEIQNKTCEVDRLEKLLEEFDSLAQEKDDLRLLLRLKDEEVRMLNKDVNRLSDRVSDYNEIEAHNTDLQSELFSRDREVMSLKHSEERLRTTYLGLVKKNGELEEKLLEQDSKHEDQKKKFEGSIMKLTNRLIQQRKKSEELEQANARSVRDCRLAVRLLQCASPASNEHAAKLNQSNKLSFLFGDPKNRPISSNDTNNLKKDLKQLRQNSFEDEASCPPKPVTVSPDNYKTPQQDQKDAKSEPANTLQSPDQNAMKRNHSTSCLESGGCVECNNQDSMSVLKDLLQGKKDAIHVLRVELGKRDKEIGLLRRKLTDNVSASINNKQMAPSERMENLESRVGFLNDENFNLKYQLEICRKMLDKLSGAAPHPS